MSVQNVRLDESTPAQRRAFVTDFLNLDLDDDASDEQVSSAIERAQPGIQNIFVLDEEAAGEAPPAEEATAAEPITGKQVGTLGKTDPRWRIVIPVIETEDGSGSEDVFVGVNGRAWQIKRGVEVSVPQRVIGSLDNAVQDILRHDEEGEEVRRKAKRFTYETVERPSDAEIAAWDEAIGAEFCA